MTPPLRHTNARADSMPLRRRAPWSLLLLALGLAIWVTWPQPSAPQVALAQDPSSPLSTPTPTKVRRVVNEVRHPQAGDAVAGVTPIIGTALVNLFNRYDVHVSPAGLENWQWLATTLAVVHDDVLYPWDTTQFADGFYDLRVRAIDDLGNYTEAFVRGLEVRNANPPTPTPLPPGATPPLTSPLPVPTATPDPRRQSPGGMGFYAPDAGAVVRGAVEIVATVAALPRNPFARWELSLARAGMEDWRWIAAGEQQAWQSPIFTWDTTALPDGLYDLRLRVVYKDSNYNEYFLRNLSIANAGRPQLAFAPPVGISDPRPGASVQGVVEFRGTVPAERLLRWELSWSPGGREQWQFLVSSESPVGNGLLARLDVRMLPAGLYDFRLRVVRDDANYTDYVLRGLRVLGS